MEHPALPTLRQLGYLVELSVRLNFRIAAEGQFVTQSTMSAGIKELETVLGVQLVERDNRNVRLTAIGEDVAARAKELLASATDLAEAARAATRPLSGPLRLGAIPTIAPYLLPRVLPALRRVHGDLKLYLREDVTKVLLERLRAGGLDVALIALPFDTGDLYVRELFKDEFWFVARQADPAVREKDVALRRIDTADMLLLEEGHCLRDHAIRLRSAPRRLGVAGRGHQPDHVDPDGRRRAGRDPAARDHARRRHPQGDAAGGAPVLEGGAVAYARPGGTAHLPAPGRRRSPGGISRR